MPSPTYYLPPIVYQEQHLPTWTSLTTPKLSTLAYLLANSDELLFDVIIDV
jgi:hypothetical protein